MKTTIRIYAALLIVTGRASCRAGAVERHDVTQNVENGAGIPWTRELRPPAETYYGGSSDQGLPVYQSEEIMSTDTSETITIHDFIAERNTPFMYEVGDGHPSSTKKTTVKEYSLPGTVSVYYDGAGRQAFPASGSVVNQDAAVWKRLDGRYSGEEEKPEIRSSVVHVSDPDEIAFTAAGYPSGIKNAPKISTAFSVETSPVVWSHIESRPEQNLDAMFPGAYISEHYSPVETPHTVEKVEINAPDFPHPHGKVPLKHSVREEQSRHRLPAVLSTSDANLDSAAGAYAVSVQPHAPIIGIYITSPSLFEQIKNFRAPQNLQTDSILLDRVRSDSSVAQRASGYGSTMTDTVIETVQQIPTVSEAHSTVYHTANLTPVKSVVRQEHRVVPAGQLFHEEVEIAPAEMASTTVSSSNPMNHEVQVFKQISSMPITEKYVGYKTYVHDSSKDMVQPVQDVEVRRPTLTKFFSLPKHQEKEVIVKEMAPTRFHRVENLVRPVSSVRQSTHHSRTFALPTEKVYSHQSVVPTSHRHVVYNAPSQSSYERTEHTVVKRPPESAMIPHPPLVKAQNYIVEDVVVKRIPQAVQTVGHHQSPLLSFGTERQDFVNSVKQVFSPAFEQVTLNIPKEKNRKYLSEVQTPLIATDYRPPPVYHRVVSTNVPEEIKDHHYYSYATADATIPLTDVYYQTLRIESPEETKYVGDMNAQEIAGPEVQEIHAEYSTTKSSVPEPAVGENLLTVDKYTKAESNPGDWKIVSQGQAPLPEPVETVHAGAMDAKPQGYVPEAATSPEYAIGIQNEPGIAIPVYLGFVKCNRGIAGGAYPQLIFVAGLTPDCIPAYNNFGNTLTQVAENPRFLKQPKPAAPAVVSPVGMNYWSASEAAGHSPPAFVQQIHSYASDLPVPPDYYSKKVSLPMAQAEYDRHGPDRGHQMSVNGVPYTTGWGQTVYYGYNSPIFRRNGETSDAKNVVKRSSGHDPLAEIISDRSEQAISYDAPNNRYVRQLSDRSSKDPTGNRFSEDSRRWRKKRCGIIKALTPRKNLANNSIDSGDRGLGRFHSRAVTVANH